MNKILCKKEQIEKKYGKDFGAGDTKKVVEYLQKQGYPSLASLISLGDKSNE